MVAIGLHKVPISIGYIQEVLMSSSLSVSANDNTFTWLGTGKDDISESIDFGILEVVVSAIVVVAEL